MVDVCGWHFSRSCFVVGKQWPWGYLRILIWCGCWEAQYTLSYSWWVDPRSRRPSPRCGESTRSPLSWRLSERFSQSRSKDWACWRVTIRGRRSECNSPGNGKSCLYNVHFCRYDSEIMIQLNNNSLRVGWSVSHCISTKNNYFLLLC